jgi:hypothetical protein
LLQIFDTLARFVARGYKSLGFLQYAQIGLEVIDRGQRPVHRNDFILGVDGLQRCLPHGKLDGLAGGRIDVAEDVFEPVARILC